MKKKWIIIGIIGIFLIGGIVACKHGCRFGGMDEFDLAAITNRIASRLDLTEPQKTQLEQMAGEVVEKAKAMHADREVHMKQLADLVRQDAIDAGAVESMIEQKMVSMREMADFVIPRLIAFHGELTPEQREKLATRIEQHAEGGCRFDFR